MSKRTAATTLMAVYGIAITLIFGTFIKERNGMVKLKPPLEKHIQRQILDYLAANKIFAWKNHTGGQYMPRNERFIPSPSKGASDIFGILNQGFAKGRFLAIEVKRPGGRVTQLQQNFIDNVNENGGYAFVAYSVDDVIEKLRDIHEIR